MLGKQTVLKHLLKVLVFFCWLGNGGLGVISVFVSFFMGGEGVFLVVFGWFLLI